MLVYSEGNAVAEKYTRDSYENVRALEGEERVTFFASNAAVEETVPRYAGGTNAAGGYLNRGSGWADAEAGVRFARQMLAERKNVTIRPDAEVERLLFDDDNDDADSSKVTGVRLKNNTSLKADLVVLATGAWTPQLVDLGGIAEATGQVLAYIQISDEEQAQLAHMPTILSFATGIFIIPPRNNELKIARHAYGYRNPQTVQVPVAGGKAEQFEDVSVPENGVSAPQEGERACRQALSEMLPAFANRPFIRTRVCWYTDTCVSPFFLQDTCRC